MCACTCVLRVIAQQKGIYRRRRRCRRRHHHHYRHHYLS